MPMSPHLAGDKERKMAIHALSDRVSQIILSLDHRMVLDSELLPSHVLLTAQVGWMMPE